MIHRKTTAVFLVLLLILTVCISGQISAQIDDSQSASTRLVEGFDIEEGDTLASGLEWDVRASRFITQTDAKPYPQTTLVSGYAPVFMESSLQSSDLDNARLFAIRAAFNMKGTNYLYLIPTDTSKKDGREGIFTYSKDARDGKSFKKGDVIPGIYFRDPISSVGIYAFGVFRDYYVDVEFETYSGEIFLVSLGKLNYKGWKILEGDVPFYKYVSTRDIVVNDYYLRLNRIIIRTRRGEVVNDFDLFFDSLFISKPIQENASEFYDGYQLAQPGVSDTFFESKEE